MRVTNAEQRMGQPGNHVQMESLIIGDFDETSLFATPTLAPAETKPFRETNKTSPQSSRNSP